MAETLTNGQIEERVKKVVVTQLAISPEEVTAQSHFVDQLGADSLDLTELAIAFEDEFDIEVPEADFGQLSTVEGVVRYISGRLNA